MRLRRVPEHARSASGPGSVGRPLPHVRVRSSESGEIRVVGPDMLGYLGDPRRDDRSDESQPATSARSMPTATCTSAAAPRNLFITSFGRNVSPEWVEREIAQRLPQRHVLVHRRGAALRGRARERNPGDAEAAAVERAIAARQRRAARLRAGAPLGVRTRTLHVRRTAC